MRRPCPRRLGSLVQANARRLLLGLSLALLVLCVAIKSAKLDAELSSWIQRTSRIEHELDTVTTAIGANGAGTNSLLLLQTPRYPSASTSHNRQAQYQPADVLSVESLMVHLEAMAIATHLTIDLYEVSWSLKDICFSPTPPDYEGLHINLMLDHLLPCAIKTPLDCFWEGAKLLGPEQPVTMGSWGPKLKWTSLDPIQMVEAKQRAHPHASFPYDTLISWMKRVGIGSGYLEKPCLDPSDQNCPYTAPNKLSGEAPNVGAELTGGCYGLATKQMHWMEQELVGGVVRNRSGHIVHAGALQSTIQLMGEQDMYDYWRKTSKVQDVNNWSTDKAKLVLDAWQRKFKEELAQFQRTSSSSRSFKIHAMTPKSMLEPIDPNSLLDMTNFELSFALMTIFTCICFPSFKQDTKNNEATSGCQDISSGNKQTDKQYSQKVTINRFKLTLLAILTSSFIGLTFVASLGLSSFMNLPFNLATTQILPPLALYYGFKQAIMIANIYSQTFQHVPIEDLTTECLNEMLPVIFLESITYIVPLLVATVIPVSATRMFIFQAIIYIVLSSFTVLLLMPSLLTTFLIHHSHQSEDESAIYHIYSTHMSRPKSRSESPGRFSISSKKSVKQNQNEDSLIEDQILSRIQDDLKNIRADKHQPTDFNFSAQFGPNRLQTSFRVTTSGTRHPESSMRTDNSTTTTTATRSQQYRMNDQQSESELDPGLPDLIQWPINLQKTKPDDDPEHKLDEKTAHVVEKPIKEIPQPSVNEDQTSCGLIEIYLKSLTENKFIQALVCSLKITIFIAILTQASQVNYGLQLKDIVVHGTAEYESFTVQEKYFPVFNVFMITRGNIDYPSSQGLLHEFYKRIERVDGIVRNDGTSGKFWLFYFRDWLLELQNKFDEDRNKSAISSEGWDQEASDASKLAYKLLAQTGRVDNPIDRAHVESNRLVDENGIINQKAFYYYLTAWVMNDAFTYSNSEANFRPEPKTWNDGPEDLRIERARPITFAQIPFLMKLPANHDSLKIISEIRSISQAFEQLNLPNIPAGIPFIFWDQFLNLDLLFLAVGAISIGLLYLVISLIVSDFVTTALITIPIIMTIAEMYGIMGYLSIPFNNILAVLLINAIGMATVQTIHYTTCFENKHGDLITRTKESIHHRLRVVISGLLLLFICALIFRSSRVDFMIKYSQLLLSMALINTFNSLLFTPALLSIFGSKCRTDHSSEPIKRNHESSKKVYQQSDKIKHRVVKKRNHQRVQSEISLSTISEEPQSEARTHDFKLDFSIRCY